MKKLLLLILLISTFPIAIFSEDEWLDDENIKIEVIEKKNITKLNYFEEHFSGYVFSTYSTGEQINRLIFESRLRFNEHYKNFRFLAEYRFQHSMLNTPVEKHTNNEKTTKNKTYTYDLSEFRELYIDFTINQQLMIRGGKQTIIWGQFSQFSPIDLLLPFDFAVIGPSLNKEFIKQPVESYNIVFTPTSEWSHTFYYLPKFTLDHTSREALNRIKNDGGHIYYPSSNKENQFAFRSVYNSSDITYGITLFQGYEVIMDDYETFSSIEYQNNDPTQKIRQVNSSESYFFPKKYAIALEVSKMLNETDKLIGEVLIQTRKRPLNSLSQSRHTESGNQAKIVEYLNWVNNENDGLFYAKQYTVISSIGYEKNVGRHSFNIGLTYIHTINPDKTQKGIDLEKETGVKNDDEDYTEQYTIFGSLTYLYYLNDEKNQAVGAMLGYLGSGMGASLFYLLELYESLNIVLGYEYIEYMGGLSYGADESNEEHIKDITEESFRFGLQYQF